MPILTDLKLIHLSPLEVVHLQFERRIEAHLRELGISIIGDLDIRPSHMNVPHWLNKAVETRLGLISKHSDEWGTQWSKVWQALEKGPFNYVFSSRPYDFCKACSAVPLEVLRLRAGGILNIPIRAGYETLGDLMSAIETNSPLLNYFGKQKMIKLAAFLEQEIRTCACEHHAKGSKFNTNQADNAQDEPSRAKTDNPKSRQAEIQKALYEIPISALGLGKKTLYLQDRGWLSVGDLPTDLEAICETARLGRVTAERALAAKFNLIGSFQNGHIDRKQFAKRENLPLIPKPKSKSDLSLAEWFRNSLIEAAAYDKSPYASLIVTQRVCRVGPATGKLDTLGKMIKKGVTKEGVRQVEFQYLTRLREGLLHPWSRGLACLFTDEFCQPFMALASELAQQETIEVHDLLDKIERCWNCDRSDAFELLPMVITIIEGTARKNKNFKSLSDFSDALLQPLSPPAKDWPAWNLGLGDNLGSQMGANAIKTAEALRLAWIEGFDFKTETESLRQGLTYLSALKPKSEPDCDELSEAMGKQIFPKISKKATGYLDTLINDLCTIIGRADLHPLAKDVFLRRSARPVGKRAFPYRLAQEYEMTQAFVMRTQTYTLKRLYNLIRNETAGDTGIIFRPDWLELWRKLETLYNLSHPDQDQFLRTVMSTFKAPEDTVATTLPAIWKILSTPTSNRTKDGRHNETVSNRNATPPVRLKDFRGTQH